MRLSLNEYKGISFNAYDIEFVLYELKEEHINSRNWELNKIKEVADQVAILEED